MKFLTFLLFLAISPLPWNTTALAVISTRSSCEETLTAPKEILTVAKNSSKYFIGALAQMYDGRRHLFLSSYRNRHKNIHSWLLKHFPSSQKSVKYLWMGEIQATSEKLLITNASGFFGNVLHAPGSHQNRSQELVNLLKQHFTSDLEITYADDQRHVLPDLNKFLAGFEQLKQSGRLLPQETSRHYMLNRANAVLNGIQFVFQNQEKYPSDSDKRAGLAELFTRDLDHLAVKIYLTLLANDEDAQERIPLKVLQALERLKVFALQTSDPTLRLADFNNLPELIEEFLSSAQDNLNNPSDEISVLTFEN